MSNERGEYQHGLGDLNEQYALERGDFLQSSGSIMPASLPSEAPQNTQTPKIPSGVTPTYPTLPANAGHFSYGQQATVSGATATNAIVFTQIIPPGYVMYANNFSVTVEDTSVFQTATVDLGVPLKAIQVTLFLNGQAALFNQNIFIQPFDGYYPCTIIGRGGDIVTIGVTYNYSAQPTPPDTVYFTAHLNGDMLLPNELPIPYTALKNSAMPVFDVGRPNV